MAKITFTWNRGKVVADLSRWNKKTTTSIAESVKSHAIQIENEAKQTAPKDTGLLRASIHTQFQANGLTALIGTPKTYGAYMEFGTRDQVDAPAGFKTMAKRFMGSGGKTTGYHLKAWAKRHGLTGLEWAIANRINRFGTKPRPFLVPAFKNGSKAFAKDLRRILKNAR